MKKRCDWPGANELMIVYHDTEWGVVLHDDRKLFEFLLLDNARAFIKVQEEFGSFDEYIWRFVEG